MSTAARLLTFDDLAETPNDGQRYEIIGGELFVSPSPEAIHQRLLRVLLLLLNDFVTEQQLGEVFFAPLDVRLAPHDIVQPDLIVLSAARFGVVESRPIEGAPDLIVEILSPSTRDHDQVRKAELYARSGVPEYWIVDTEARTLRGLTLVEGRYETIAQEGSVLRSVVLPDLTIDIAALFGGLP